MRRAAFLLIILFLALGVMGPETARAQPSSAPTGASATWSSDIIYFNLTSITGKDSKGNIIPKNLTVEFSGNGTTAEYKDTISYQYYSNTILAGSIGKSFAGSAVLSAEVPVVAVYKQVSSNSNPYSPILYTSFSLDQAGNGKFYVPSVERNPAFVSQIGVQNIEAVDLDLTLNFYPAGGGAPYTATKAGVKSQSSYVFKLSDLPNFPLKFDGSLVITAVPSDHGNETADIVAAVQEVQGNGRQAFAYEGSAGGAGAIYMPSAMCKVGKTQQTTTYAIQNVDSNPADVTITYYDGMGRTVGTPEVKSAVPSDSKVSVSTCDVTGTAGKTVLSAVITGTKLVAMGKVQSTDGLMTAFLGSTVPPATNQPDNLYHVALPYVEWANSTLGFRSYISIMNVSGQPVQKLELDYSRRNGKYQPVKAVQQLASANTPLAVNARINSEPDQVNGALDKSKSFLGAVEVLSDQPVVVIVRVQRGVSGLPGVTTLGEDYSGINITNDPNS